jgi:hypothetical protein
LNVVGSGLITTSATGKTLTIASNQIATSSILGRVTASTGNIETLTGTQATTLLDVFTSTLKGLVPASGGGTTNFLRADGTWAAAGGGTTIYTGDGTLTSARTLTSGGFDLTFTGSNTASSAIARGILMNHTLVAAANSDVLVGLDITPTFTNGAFTGVDNIGLRINGTNSSTRIYNDRISVRDTRGGSNTPMIVLTTSTFNSQIICGNSTYGIAAGANSLNFWHTVNGPIAFFNGGTTPTRRFSITGDGKVIIGSATTASSSLEVNAGFNGDGVSLKSTQINSAYYISHTASGAVTWTLNSAGTGSSQTAGTLAIGATTNAMLLFSNGNIVLGASNSANAGFKLDVNGTARISGQISADLISSTLPSIKSGGIYLQSANAINNLIGFNTFYNGTAYRAISTGFYGYLQYDNGSYLLYGSNASTTAGSSGTLINYFNFNQTESRIFADRLKSNNTTYLDISAGSSANTNTYFTKFSFFSGGFSHYLVSRHDSVASSVQNQISLYLNNSTTSGGSSAPTTGNVLNNTQSAISSAFFQPTLFKIGGAVNESPVATAAVEIVSTTRGFLPPRMTTTQRNAIASPAAGLIVYDTTLNKLCVYTTAWETITSL